ncbi:hypothetical protein BG32_11660 [Mesotoga sp. HF07.pep.5.2.highcov]|uniref:DUF1680 family protein n=1 Tax=Mesotoga prima MesG1.Ag.4.2 TaxID=660470 RepID=I2F7T7_9BACT|nr:MULTISPECIES: beta-L-arabinofuranosidase domain-containing protein [Mesotoga]AFK07990.1 Putative glycosyl hydrolase of unknown function (DUF1680) [Mesotoga prima MesG1.Ag.4.2]RLL89108.1 hypothetical protein Y696_03335 [Mesotoga sp. H07pep.5.4]RLL92080.1 hypothetical protein BG32_11660 [Mesotoga sp. HF07.pep.5.2.highcov]
MIDVELMELPLGEIRPAGWLERQLKIQAKGLTGRLEEVWKDVGPDSGWLGGSGENWERGPYYCDGLIPLAYLLEDEKLKGKAAKWISWTLESQNEEGFFGPRDNDDWWPRMVMLKVLKNYFEYTKDQRVVHFMTRYFMYQLQNIDSREFAIWENTRSVENIYVILWLYSITGEGFLIDLAKRFFEKSMNWSNYFENFKYTKPTGEYLDWEKFMKATGGKGLEGLYEYEERTNSTTYSKLFQETHVVNVVMGVKYPALRYLLYGEKNQLKIVKEGIKKLIDYHGTSNGMVTGDEHLNGNDPSRGTELCAVVEYMFSLEILFRVFNDTEFADILEKIAYNALPATIDKELLTHQYDQQVNQIMCSHAKRNWYNNLDDSNLFGLEPNFGCCTANMHQGWPKFVKNLCYKSDDGGLVFGVYGPCKIETSVAGQTILIREVTDYPFDDKIEILIDNNADFEIPLHFRIPGWATKSEVTLNGSAFDPENNEGYLTIKRLWNRGDRVELVFRSRVRTSKWFKNSLSVEKGPLLFALRLDEKWNTTNKDGEFPEYEVYTTSPWNYALKVDLKNPEKSFSFIKRTQQLSEQPFDQNLVPVLIEADAAKVEEWSWERNSAGTLPESPVRPEGPLEKVCLIPYGAARLRIAQFPYFEE